MDISVTDFKVRCLDIIRRVEKGGAYRHPAHLLPQGGDVWRRTPPSVGGGEGQRAGGHPPHISVPGTGSGGHAGGTRQLATYPDHHRGLDWCAQLPQNSYASVTFESVARERPSAAWRALLARDAPVQVALISHSIPPVLHDRGQGVQKDFHGGPVCVVLIDVVLALDTLPAGFHGDRADRLIVASARAWSAIRHS